jgi:hypothetical protein
MTPSTAASVAIFHPTAHSYQHRAITASAHANPQQQDHHPPGRSHTDPGNPRTPPAQRPARTCGHCAPRFRPGPTSCLR